MSEESRDYLSLRGVDGRRWRFAKCPFGLSSSPAALICALVQLFSNRCRYQGISVYMDDLAVFSRTFQAHLRQIELALDTLKNANLSVNGNRIPRDRVLRIQNFRHRNPTE